jgi:Heterokaryon incompatibility protein (HET)
MRSRILRSPVLRQLAQKGRLNPGNGRLIQRQPPRERVPFQYVPLCKEPQQIRLAWASRRRVDGCAFISEDAVLNLELHNVSLSDAPSYIALSYTWGDANDTLDIVCNDQFLHVTRTLAQTVYTVLCAVEASSTPPYDEGEDVWF